MKNSEFFASIALSSAFWRTLALDGPIGMPPSRVFEMRAFLHKSQAEDCLPSILQKGALDEEIQRALVLNVFWSLLMFRVIVPSKSTRVASGWVV